MTTPLLFPLSRLWRTRSSRGGIIWVGMIVLIVAACVAAVFLIHQ